MSLFLAPLIAYLSLCNVTLRVQEVTPTGRTELTQCSAVFVGPQELLTAAHCVEHNKSGRMWIRTSAGKSFSANLVRKDKKSDIALIKIKGPKHATYARLGSEPHKGQSVYLVSSEDNMPGTFNQGIVSNLIVDPQINTPVIVHSAGILGGASGSGLFNRQGQLIGLNVMTLKHVTYAVDIGVIRRFIEDTDQRRRYSPM